MKRKKYVRHGLSKHPQYSSWANMIRRCYNPNNQRYYAYGERGIKVCQRWLDSFANYLEDVGERPGKEYTLDRIDNDGDYEPGNVRWADFYTQNHNQGVSSNNTSGHTGVARTKNGKKWRAYICVNRKIISLGEYINKQDAIAARKNAEKIYV